MRWLFRIEYDGALFAGWQTQPNGSSVQEELEKAFTTIVRQKCKVTGAGRTDAGVHASGQAAHVDLPENIDIGRVEASINAILPRSIAVREFTEVSPDFSARFSALERTYKYYFAGRKMPLRTGRVWVVKYSIDWKRVASELPCLIGRHDFRAFCAANHGARTTICTVKSAVLRKNGELRVLTIVADRYLYKMVRSIAGTLIDIGRGAISEPLSRILKRGDRKSVGETAPAWGLVLENVKYHKAGTI